MMQSRSIFTYVACLFLSAANCSSDKQQEIDKKFAEANRQFEGQNTAQALKLYSEILNTDSKHTGSQVMSGRILYYDRKFTDAEKRLQKAVDDHPENVDALFWLARVQSVVPEKKEEALKNLDLLLQRDGSRADALVLKGMLHEEKKEIPKAIIAYRAATRAELDAGQAYLRLASIYGAAGLDEMKRKSLVRAALLAPELLKQQ